MSWRVPILCGYDRYVTAAAMDDVEEKGFAEDRAPVSSRSGTFSSKGLFLPTEGWPIGCSAHSSKDDIPNMPQTHVILARAHGAQKSPRSPDQPLHETCPADPAKGTKAARPADPAPLPDWRLVVAAGFLALAASFHLAYCPGAVSGSPRMVIIWSVTCQWAEA